MGFTTLLVAVAVLAAAAPACAAANSQVATVSATVVKPLTLKWVQNLDLGTLMLVVDSPGTFLIPNSGNPGVNFSLGGSINLSSSTAGGVYSGTFNVTVDY